MSLSGRLEDLRLRDLLQIVGLSRNSGLLQMDCARGRAELLFADGVVLSAWRTGGREVRSELGRTTVDAALLARARQLQQADERFRSLDRLLVEECGLDPERLYPALRLELVATVAELLCWEEGDFSFRSGSVAESLAQIARGDHLCLDVGFDTQELLQSPTSERYPATQPWGAPLVAEGQQRLPQVDDDPVPVFLVDDDPQVRGLLVQALSRQGLAARAFASGAELLEAVSSGLAAGDPELLVIDLVMPRRHGGGILGGLELVEQLYGARNDLPCLVYTDYSCREAEQRLRQLGVAELSVKPNRRQCAAGEHPQLLADFCTELAARVADTLKATLGEGTAVAAADDHPAPLEQQATAHAALFGSSDLGLLRDMLQELRHVDSGDQVRLLVLRFATEVLDRAVLFSVANEQVVGLGQFGYGSADYSADQKVRRICVPLAEPSALQPVVQRGDCARGFFGEGRWDRYLCQELELCADDEVFFGPLISGGRAVALLCGASRPAGGGIVGSEALEIFLQQAGVALERLQLAENLRNLMLRKDLAGVPQA